ncbi:hydroxyethylthiazole kinase [Parapedobacter koreensis]|uniref:Hydroxyethylthiazole kinase n=1 Tax=Parapedobacter koreensis TaxID=332977 RepID=A0A1H7LSD2_9SPHI|nr:hydroxyethylthiazole kinase [Parapedobacter koreensis]SEL01816.1 hydroxyethylthiazole kinase [Parapedobacter koreensis]
MEKRLWNHVLTVRQQSPLVQNITNFVVMNNSANALLAVGASPIMAHAEGELADMARICQSLVINIGTLDDYWFESMLQASATAQRSGKPWVLDPVGVGATLYRDNAISQLLALQPTVVRGNASEIMALAKANNKATKGVDSTAASDEALDAARFIRYRYGSVVCISGEVDIVVGEGRPIYIRNGDPLMTRVTGLGCSATAIIGAFVAVVEDVVEAVSAAMALLGISGELAAAESAGPGSLQANLLDKLYNITEEEFAMRIRVSHEG